MINKNYFRFLFVSIFVCVSIGVSGCSESYDSMMDDYNKKFIPMSSIPEKILPGDENFDEATMLDSEYVVNEWETLNISGPEGCVSYTWYIKNKKDEIKYESDKKDFSFFFYENPVFKPGKWMLYLRVECADNRVYEDSANLQITKHY